MRSVEEHQRIVAGLIAARTAATAALADAASQVLAGDVVAPVSLPIFDNSAMDGYAVHADEVASATATNPVELVVVEDIPAGRAVVPALEPGTAHRIMTGAPIPAGATAVVPVEATNGSIDVVTINAPSAQGRYIRCAGEDVRAGTTVLHAGQVVTPAVVALAAALGLHELMVIPRQRVLVISTGSELVSPGRPRQAGQIFDSNSMMLASAVREAGADVVAIETANDDVAQFVSLLNRYAAESDLIITSGGVSAGAYEVVKDAFGRTGAKGVEFVKVAMQPGMPQGAGEVAGTPLVAVPGNPVSALVSFEVFIRPALRLAMGLPVWQRQRRSATLTETLTSPPGKRQFRRGVFDAAAGSVVSSGPPGSHHVRWLASANCLLDIPADVAEIPAGSRLQIWDLS